MLPFLLSFVDYDASPEVYERWVRHLFPDLLMVTYY
jgi:hypothetical protein